MKKSIVTRFHPGSAEYVVLHAKWQRSRGRQPSVSFAGERNPRRALLKASRLVVDYMLLGWQNPSETRLLPDGTVEISMPGRVCEIASHRGVVKVVCDDGEFYAGVVTTIDQFVTPPFPSAEAFARYAAEHMTTFLGVEHDEVFWMEMAQNAMVIQLRSADILHLCTLMGELKRGVALKTEDCLALYGLHQFLKFTVAVHRSDDPETYMTAGNQKIDRLGMRTFFPEDWDWWDILDHADGVGYYNACTRVMYPEQSHDSVERCPELSRQLCGWYFAERMKLAGIAGEGKRSPVEAMQFFFDKYMMKDQG